MNVLTVDEFATIYRFGEDVFPVLYGDSYQYGVVPRGSAPHDPALNALAATLVGQSNQARLESFCNSLATAISINQFREGHLVVAPMHERLADRLGLPSDTPMFAVYPKQGFTDVVLNEEQGRQRWLRTRLFKATREGIVFVPFDVDVVMRPYV